jgi:hypothetical protein
MTNEEPHEGRRLGTDAEGPGRPPGTGIDPDQTADLDAGPAEAGVEVSQRVTDRWRAVQRTFAADLERVVGEAARALAECLDGMGYSVNQQGEIADPRRFAHDWPDLLDELQHVHSVGRANEHRQASASDLMTAMASYDSLFAALAQTPTFSEIFGGEESVGGLAMPEG